MFPGSRPPNEAPWRTEEAKFESKAAPSDDGPTLHSSYMDARPGANVGIKVTASLPSHPSQIQSWEEKEKERKKEK